MADLLPRVSELDPLQASAEITEDYLRYVQTAFPLKDARLREQLRRLVRRPDFLVKGPYLEGTPPLRRAHSVRQLIAEGTLCSAVERLEGNGFPESGYPLDRPLYAHQEAAIRKIRAGRNVVVATGTGSGKTEAFLIPVIDALLREQEAGGLEEPGVRALVLYPMNALANDQLKRLRRLLREMPAVTFGRYTGQTVQTRKRAEEDFVRVFPGEPRVDNELICRDDIRDRPPHILLTNYAMLEYLLLRPKDTTLFDGPTGKRWSFLVVDEAHTYSGAAGMEVGMLLRRLKDRVVSSRPGSIRCVATSATLGRGRDDFAQLVHFASTLFGEEFTWDDRDVSRQDVVEAEFEPIEPLGSKWGSPAPRLYRQLQVAALETDAMAAAAAAAGVPGKVMSDAIGESQGGKLGFLHGILRGDERVWKLREALAERPVPMHCAAELLFGDSSQESLASLVSLVALSARARQSEDSAPLLPARYHLFARALEGGYVTFPRIDAPHLHLEAVDQVEVDGTPCQAFEIATCTRCGQVFLTGVVRDAWDAREPGEYAGRRLRPIAERYADWNSPAKKVFFTWDEVGEANSDEDEAILADAELTTERLGRWTLCTGCGALEPGEVCPACRCGSHRQLPLYEAAMREGRLATCPFCGAQTRHDDVANRLRTGQDAPVAVLATSLYQLLPGTDESRGPARGRKLLIFSDSRQDAAYFGPYLERTHLSLLHRRLILQALALHQGQYGTAPARPVSFAENHLRQLAHDLRLFRGPADPVQERRRLCTWVFQELLSFERRIGLEGACLVAVNYTRPQEWDLPAVLGSDPWYLSDDEGWSLVQVLLDTLRFSGAVRVDPADITSEEFEPRNRSVYYRQVGGDSAPAITILGWLPQRAIREHITNRRFDYVARVLQKRTGSQADPALVMATLTEIWRSLTPTDPRLLEAVMLKEAKLGAVHRIDPRYIELRHGASPSVQWFQCNICRTRCVSTLDGVCPTMGCTGNLEPFDPATDLRDHHYRDIYQRMNAVPMRVCEHTAQWHARKAAEIQQQFVDGRVNALSCSTTFELGVDVGELQAVLMRNVPPSTARYVQRAGRAGRRLGAAAFAVTYAQRRPHDLAQFADPEEFITGKIKPPAVELSNAKIVRRHVHAVALADLFRLNRTRFRTVSAFFSAAEDGRTGPELLALMLDARPVALLSALRRIVPADPCIRAELGLDQWGWVAGLLEVGQGALSKAELEVHSDLSEYKRLQQEASAGERYSLAAFYKHQANRVSRRPLLGFLASRNVLPKYGFPVDLVELQLKAAHPQSESLELQRDLRIAVSEYAPGSHVVAGHCVWESTGIRRLPHRQPAEYSYVICGHCGRFHRSITAEAMPSACEACQERLAGRACRSGTFIVPEFGFFSTEPPKSVKLTRPERLYSSRVYFSEFASTPAAADFVRFGAGRQGAEHALDYRYSRHGRLVVVNSGRGGRGFTICQHCGYARPVALRPPHHATFEHRTAYGRQCNGPRRTLHLGHEFLTDVLELRFSGPPIMDSENSLWLSLTYACLEGAASALGIERDDMDGCLYPYASGGHAPAIILYDSIPGGAGHVKRVAEHLADVLREALRRVRSCKQCDEDTACYACLKSYDNQFCHHLLKRGPVGCFLEALGIRG